VRQRDSCWRGRGDDLNVRSYAGREEGPDRRGLLRYLSAKPATGARGGEEMRPPWFSGWQQEPGSSRQRSTARP
jgi:hypothetical protein